jgi:hypothetical protein
LRRTHDDPDRDRDAYRRDNGLHRKASHGSTNIRLGIFGPTTVLRSPPPGWLRALSASLPATDAGPLQLPKYRNKAPAKADRNQDEQKCFVYIGERCHGDLQCVSPRCVAKRKSVRDHLIEIKIGDIHEFGGSKMQSTAGNSPGPKQTCHRLSRDCLRNF